MITPDSFSLWLTILILLVLYGLGIIFCWCFPKVPKMLKSWFCFDSCTNDPNYTRRTREQNRVHEYIKNYYPVESYPNAPIVDPDRIYIGDNRLPSFHSSIGNMLLFPKTPSPEAHTGAGPTGVLPLIDISNSRNAYSNVFLNVSPSSNLDLNMQVRPLHFNIKQDALSRLHPILNTRSLSEHSNNNSYVYQIPLAHHFRRTTSLSVDDDISPPLYYSKENIVSPKQTRNVQSDNNSVINYDTNNPITNIKTPKKCSSFSTSPTNRAFKLPQTVHEHEQDIQNTRLSEIDVLNLPESDTRRNSDDADGSKKDAE